MNKKFYYLSINVWVLYTEFNNKCACGRSKEAAAASKLNKTFCFITSITYTVLNKELKQFNAFMGAV